MHAEAILLLLLLMLAVLRPSSRTPRPPQTYVWRVDEPRERANGGQGGGCAALVGALAMLVLLLAVLLGQA